MVKKAGIIALILFVVSCGGTWQEKLRSGADISVAAGKQAVHLSSKVCDEILLKCVDARTNPCPNLGKCHLVENHILRGYVALTAAAKAAVHAIKLGDQKAAIAKLLEAQHILNALRAALAAYGVKL